MKSLIKSIPRSRAEALTRAQRLMQSPAARSAIWVLLGSGGTQFIRLLGNLLLTRLLFPEVFGIIALIYAITIGLTQISDIGLRQSVVNSDRIDDPKFMQTAWTVQLIQASFITFVAILLAFPAAQFYDEPTLTPVLIAIACCTLLSGFKSIALLAYDKRLDLKRQTMVDLGMQLGGMSVVIVIALVWPSVWAMVAGQVVASLMEVFFSYFLFKGHHSRLTWEPRSVRELFGFGKWIFISSTISYLTNQGDRLILGIFITMAELGKYSIASTWAALVALLSVNISFRVLHPYFRSTFDSHSDFLQIHRVRTLLNVAYVGVCVFLALIGEWLVDFLYDERYQAAGWMLQVLAVGQIGRVFTGTLMPFLLARGDSFSQMKFSAISAVILITFLLAGGHFAGTPGLVLAYALTAICSHPMMVFYASRHGYHCAKTDFSLILFGVVFCFFVWWLIDASILDVLGSLVTAPH